MRNLLLTLLLVSSAAFAQVQPQTAANDAGQLFIRLYNDAFNYTSCYYRDEYNYFTFTIAPQSFTKWYPVYGRYEWQCR